MCGRFGSQSRKHRKPTTKISIKNRMRRCFFLCEDVQKENLDYCRILKCCCFLAEVFQGSLAGEKLGLKDERAKFECGEAISIWELFSAKRFQ